MRKYEIRVGDRVTLRQRISTSTAHVIGKYQKTVSLRFRVTGQVRSVAYEDIVSVFTSQDLPLGELVPHLLNKPNHEYAILCASNLLQQYLLVDWDFQIDEAPIGRGGQCGHARKVIALTSAYIERASHAEIRDTVLHEIAHALVGPEHIHDAVWRQKALEIGCNGKRTHNVKMPKRWLKYCPNMHWVRTTQRRNLKRRRICNECGAFTEYERYSNERYEELQQEVV